MLQVPCHCAIQQDDDQTPSQIEDGGLVRQALVGDSRSFQQLYRRYQQRVRSTLYQLCGPSILDDLVQEVFLRAWKGLPRLREPSQFSTWLYRISWNVATDQRRKWARHSSQEHRLSQLNPEEGQEPFLVQLHYQDLVQRSLAQLTLQQRAVLVLHDLEALSQKEVAAVLNIPLGTVKSRLFHARAAVRRFLQAEGVPL